MLEKIKARNEKVYSELEQDTNKKLAEYMKEC